MNLPFTDSFAIPAAGGGSSEVTDPAKLENVADLSPRKDIEEPQNTRWHSFQKVGDHQIRVFFDLGNDNYYGAYATVKETAVSVNTDVFTGGLPEAPEACPLEMGVNNSLLVTLEKPLGGRILS